MYAVTWQAPGRRHIQTHIYIYIYIYIYCFLLTHVRTAKIVHSTHLNQQLYQPIQVVQCEKQSLGRAPTKLSPKKGTGHVGMALPQHEAGDSLMHHLEFSTAHASKECGTTMQHSVIHFLLVFLAGKEGVAWDFHPLGFENTNKTSGYGYPGTFTHSHDN